MTLSIDRIESVATALVSRPRVESGVSFGIGTGRPRLSWMVSSGESDWVQGRYEVTVTRADDSRESVIVESAEQILRPWPFRPLASRERVSVSVRVGSGDSWSPASDPAAIEVGLLDREDWVADFISPDTLGGLDDGAPVLYTDARLAHSPVSARLYVSAHGVYEFAINGRRVGSDVLAPGWTAYDHRLRYQSHDVTDLLRGGVNTLGATLGNGWFRGQLVWPGNRSSYGDELALIAQLEVTFADGSTQVVATDATWRARAGRILSDDLYDGQVSDLRVDEWTNAPDRVRVVEADHARLTAPTAPPVRVTERLASIEIFASPSGAIIVDFGQNVVGWVAITVRGASRGRRVTVRHAEVLEHGELGVRPLRSAKATSTYILAGEDKESLQPTFTFHGFRYAEIDGAPDLELEDVEALVLGSDLRRTGWFASSDSRLNRLHENVVWSMRGNFLDVPTDCPQRDERLGWTGDIQVFVPTANFLFDTQGFLSGWLEDLAAEQKPDGGVPHVIPDVLRDPDPAGAGWGDAATIVPSSLHLAFGDVGVLERQYPSMVAWVGKIESIAGAAHLWDTGPQFGDWLDPTAPHDAPAEAQADPSVVATAYYARSTALLADAAATLGKEDDAARYRDLHSGIIAAFNREYVGSDGTIRSDCQTVYALALCWDLIDDDDRRLRAGRRLAELVHEADYRVSTGFAGTPVILDALEIAGFPDHAFRMLLQTQVPSWLYAVEMGATTIWERWDSMLPDGSINPGSMTSFNHYAYGAVADWMHRSIGGLTPIEPGYRRIRVRPLLGGGIEWAAVRHDSPYGSISVRWRLEGPRFFLDLEIPFGVTAEVWLPGASSPVEVGSGNHRFDTAV